MNLIKIGFSLILILFILNSCINETFSTEESTFELTDFDKKLNEKGLFFEIKSVQEPKYLVKWGESSTKFELDTIIILPSGNPKLTTLKNKGIYIQQGCGTTCSFGYVLSFENRKAQYYLYPLAVDLQNGYIAYNGEDQTSLVIVENFRNQKVLKISTDFLPNAYPGLSIDSIKFVSQNKLFIKWIGSKEDVRKEIFDLRSIN